MNKPIIVNINMFDMAQSIYMPSGTICYALKENLKYAIPKLCYDNEIFDVEVRGAVDYVNKIAREIRQQELIDYNANKINVKGVKKK